MDVNQTYVVIIMQYVQISNHYDVHLKLICQLYLKFEKGKNPNIRIYFMYLCLSWLRKNVQQTIYIYMGFFFGFLGLHPWHMEVPRLGVKSELWPQQHQIQAESATYTTAEGNTRSLTYSVRPGMEPASSWILVRFVSAEP